MRAIDQNTNYQVGAMFTDRYSTYYSKFAAFRMMDWTQTNGNAIVNWSDRPLPTPNNWGKMSWESAVAVANAMGKDIYINIPYGASADYLTNLANLLKYGSDGINSYTSVQANPVWAPLNSNLNIYIEYCNEVWNWGFLQYSRIVTLVQQEQASNSADWQLFVAAGGFIKGYPAGNTTGNDVSLWTVLKDIRISDAFRKVYGDDVMPANAQNVVNPDPRIRSVFEWQYGGGFNGGSDSRENAMKKMSAVVPHPINYYIWGGGAGWYSDIGANNGFSEVAFSNPNFDGGTNGWTLSGNAALLSKPNPLPPTDAAPLLGSGAKTSTKQSTNVVVLQGGDSISQSVKFNRGYADLTFYAIQSVPTDYVHGLKIFMDGQPIATGEGSAQTINWTWVRTEAFNTGDIPMTHTFTFTSTWDPSSGTTISLTSFGIQTVNALFSELGQLGQSHITTVQSDLFHCHRDSTESLSLVLLFRRAQIWDYICQILL